MAFIQAPAPHGTRIKSLLSADNGIPERHIVIETLRNAAPRLGLTSSVLATLDAMLSCLPPKRGHHTVFASNATLTFRRNGISDRTLRRHAAILQEAGLLVRHDSPNGKRFTRHSALEGKALRFGFDLTPLFERLSEIARLAAEVLRDAEQVAYLRCKVRAVSGELLREAPEHEVALRARKALRRKLGIEDLEALLQLLSMDKCTQGWEQDAEEIDDMSANDGQDVRHHHNSEKELIDVNAEQPSHVHQTFRLRREIEGNEQPAPLSLTELLDTCPEAAQFSLGKIENFADVVTHARSLAPMIGISERDYRAAQQKMGPVAVATTVWAMMQIYDRIRVAGAYFRSITIGAKSADFCPVQLVRQLGKAAHGRMDKRGIVRGQTSSLSEPWPEDRAGHCPYGFDPRAEAKDSAHFA